MNKATWAMLNESEKALLRQADGSSLAGLDEDQLIDLHTRVRRARTKYATLYRRRASSQVTKDADRAKAHAQHARTAVKAEAFEDALARVSLALGRSARARAAEFARGASRRGPTAAGFAAAPAGRDDSRDTGEWCAIGSDEAAHADQEARERVGARRDTTRAAHTRHALTRGL
jgi:hypothetical protein